MLDPRWALPRALVAEGDVDRMSRMESGVCMSALQSLWRRPRAGSLAGHRVSHQPVLASRRGWWSAKACREAQGREGAAGVAVSGALGLGRGRGGRDEARVGRWGHMVKAQHAFATVLRTEFLSPRCSAKSRALRRSHRPKS